MMDERSGNGTAADTGVHERDAGFPGASETAREAGGTQFVESRYTRPALMRMHAHDAAILHVVLRGRAENRTERQREPGATAQVTFLPAHMPHETHWRGGAGFAVMFRPEKAAEWAAWGLLPSYPINLEPGLISALLMAVRRESFAGDAAGVAGAEGYLSEALAELMRLPVSDGAKERGSRRLRRAREILCESHELPPTLTEIARQVEAHPVYLARAFREAFGETVGDCVRRRRIEVACRRIARSDRPLGEIALEVGFADQAHFSRTFRQYVGVPPTDYARAVRPTK